jgi:hypothetical protein
MINISQSGALISLDRELFIDTRIILLIESQQDDEPAIEITADIVRIADEPGPFACTYGCMILDVKDL